MGGLDKLRASNLGSYGTKKEMWKGVLRVAHTCTPHMHPYILNCYKHNSLLWASILKGLGWGSKSTLSQST